MKTPVVDLYPQKFLEYLAERGIATGLHYPMALHLQPVFSELRHKAGAFPAAEGITCRRVSLPRYPHLTQDQVGYVTEHVRAYFAR